MTWQPQQLPADHPRVQSGAIGVLVVNLGTPDAPDVPSVRRYLKEFLSDRRVVEIPALVWQPILRGIILNTRPKKSAQAYSKARRWRRSPAPKRKDCRRGWARRWWCAGPCATAIRRSGTNCRR